MNKNELRSRYKLIRGNVTDREKRETDILELFINSEEYRRCSTLFLYASCGTEVSTDKIAHKAFEDGKDVAYPVCSDREGNMRFYKVKHSGQLLSGMYGIREPDIAECELAVPDDRTLIVVPALAFDRRGYRLGYGKGYYDRYIDAFPCTSVGLAFECCVTDLLPADKHDIKSDVLITDKKKYIFSITKEE